MNLQRTNGDPFLQAAVAPLQQGAASSGQFLEAKGLAQYIVGTVIQ